MLKYFDIKLQFDINYFDTFEKNCISMINKQELFGNLDFKEDSVKLITGYCLKNDF